MIKPIREDFMTYTTEENNKIMGDHFQYLKDLLEKGKLVLAGPVLNEKEPFGLLIFECENKEEAKILMENDPSVKAGIQTILKLEPLRISLYKKTS